MRGGDSFEGSIRFSPEAPVLPANVLRFYLHFPRPAEASFERSGLKLLDDEGREVCDPFLVLSQELWSADGRRLTVLMEPGRMKRGMGTDPAHEPALVSGRSYSLAVAALGQVVRHRFSVGEPVFEPLDEGRWRIAAPRADSLEAAVLHFGRVMDAALCDDEIRLLDPAGEPLRTTATLDPGDATSLRIVPNRPWASGRHRLLVSDRLEDVCGNRLGEALDHGLHDASRPRGGTIAFVVTGAPARPEDRRTSVNPCRADSTDRMDLRRPLERVTAVAPICGIEGSVR